MDFRQKQEINKKNWYKPEVWSFRKDAIICALQYVMSQSDHLRSVTMEKCVRPLLEGMADIKPILKYTNSLQETIYFYLV